MHDDLKRRLHDEVDAELGTRPPRDLNEVLRRGRGKKLGIRVMTALSIFVIGAGIVAGSLWIGSLRNDAAPVPPAEENEPMRNGRILHAVPSDMYWEGPTAPPPPGGALTYHWDAFDQDSGSFLYVTQMQERKYWVIGEDGPPIAEFDCPTSSGCGGNGIESFGPNSDEITVPSQDLEDSESVHVIGFDGTLRETLDISAATDAPDQALSDLEWSPDGTRLAVSTEPEGRCDPSSGQCGGRVWIFDRDGGEPQLVYTERAKKYPSLRELAWSPDGNGLAALVAKPACGFPVDAPPRVVVLGLDPSAPARVEVEIVYEDDGSRGGCILPHHLRLDYPFAWSPDGTRIAIATGNEIHEISSSTGDVLSERLLVGGLEGPMAWLPQR